jgi:hypothetical protein
MTYLEKIFLRALLISFSAGLISCEEADNLEQGLLCIAGEYPAPIGRTQYSGFNDIDPDLYIKSGILSLDIDQDNNDDILFWSSGRFSPYTFDYYSYVDIIDTTIQFAITPDSLTPFCFNIGDTISNYIYWKNSEPYVRPCGIVFGDLKMHISSILCHAYTVDYWKDNSGYIGVRKYNLNGKYSYGWIKISVRYYNEITLYEYFYK